MKTDAVVNDSTYLSKVVDQIVEVDPKILVEDENNPNFMPVNKLKRLSKVIQKYGFLMPLIIDTTGKIIDGHQRAKAAAIAKINPTALVIDTAKTEVDKRFLRQWLNKFRGQHDAEMDIAELEILCDDELGAVMMEDYMEFKIGDLDDMRKILNTEPALTEEIPTDKKRRIILFFTAAEYPEYQEKFQKLMEQYQVGTESEVVKRMIDDILT